MQFNKDLIETLNHFGQFATSIVIHPDQPLVVCNKSRTVTALATIETGLEGTITNVGLPIFDLASFNKVVKLFAKEDDYTVDVSTHALAFESGQFSQNYHLAEASLLDNVAPRPEKVQKYFDLPAEVEFELSEDDLSRFRDAIATNRLSSIVFQSIDGTVEISCVDIDMTGVETRDSSVFKFSTGATTEKEFKVGFERDTFVMLPGNYTVKINPTNIRFVGQTVSYLFPVAKWSKMG